LDFVNVSVSQIDTISGKDFILVNFESSLNIRNVDFRDSNTTLLNLRSSKMTANNLTFTNIDNARYLFETYDVNEAEMSQISASQITTSSQSLILLKKSNNLTLSQLEINNIDKIILEVDRSHFKRIISLAFTNSKKAMLVKNSKIELFANSSFGGNGNTISKGGAFQMYNSDVTIENATFDNNIAEAGAGIHFDCSSMAMCNLAIQNSEFSNNNATEKGGAIYYGYKRPTLTNVKFLNNSASYGPNIASYPIKIRFKGNDTDSMKINNIGPNIFYEREISFALVDYDNQTVLTNSENEITISSDNNISSIVGIDSILMQKGVATFHGLTAVAPIGSKNLKFHVSSKAIDRTKINSIYGSQVSKNLVVFNFRNCQPGEYVFDSIRCLECSAQSFSFDWNSNS
jgi:hypothetical protein